MLKKMKFDEGIYKGTYKCNYCGDIFTEEYAWLKKGNIYLCSMDCVLAYDKERS
jgi:hypothetical protein